MPFSWRNPKIRDPIERRRERGEISCAECRRLKLKCNKAIPCSTCTRKGCPEICPNGTLLPSNSARHGIRGKDLQVQRLTQMSRRIRQLEDALQIAHSSTPGSERHPLLSEDFLKIKNNIEKPPLVTKEDVDSDEDIVDSFGTLSILDKGVESYVGADESVLKLGAVGVGVHRGWYPSTASPVSFPREAFPFNPLDLPSLEIQRQVEEKLPSFERASALVEAYLENTSWFVKMMDREQIVEELLPLFYKNRRSSDDSSSGHTRADPHTLSLLFAIFACGAVADLTLPPWNEEADLYYQLAWTGFSLRSMFDGTTLQTIQSLAVIGSYDIFSCRRNSLEGTCKMISYCMSLAVSIGLHRDPTHFKLPPKQVRRRRILFWGLHTMDAYKSIGTGRPMSIHPSSIDCELPEDTDATIAKDGTKLPSVWAIQYRYSKEVMSDVVDKLSSARALKYSEILNVDQKIREFGQNRIYSLTTNNALDGSTEGALKRILIMMIKETPLLLLHRNFFVRALIENPTDPTKSRFAPSFLTAYLSAVKILRALRELLNDCAHFVMRIWPIWSHALSASVLLGSVAACGSALAPQAFAEFNIAVTMLEKMQIHPIVKELYPSVLQLHRRAYEALFRSDNTGTSLRSLLPDQAPSQEIASDHTDIHGVGLITPGTLGDVAKNTGKRIPDYSLGTNLTATSSPITTTPPGFTAGALHNGTVEYSSATFGRKSLPGSHSLLQGSVVESRSLSGQSSRGSTPSGSIFGLRDSGLLQYRDDCSIPAQSQSQTISSMSIPGPPEPYTDGHGAAIPSDLLHQTESLNGSQTAPNAEFQTFHPGLGNGDQTESQRDRSNSPFTFDSLSTLPPPVSFFDTDFDVSYNMRSSTGDESILPLISDDLAPCRTILEDSRFFGYGVTASDQEGQNGFMF